MPEVSTTLTRFQFRRGLSNEWATSNPVLAEGEPALEITSTGSVRMKIGRGGSIVYSTLPYFDDTVIVTSTLTALVNGTLNAQYVKIINSTMTGTANLQTMTVNTAGTVLGTFTAQTMQSNENLVASSTLTANNAIIGSTLTTQNFVTTSATIYDLSVTSTSSVYDLTVNSTLATQNVVIAGTTISTFGIQAAELVATDDAFVTNTLTSGYLHVQNSVFINTNLSVVNTVSANSIFVMTTAASSNVYVGDSATVVNNVSAGSITVVNTAASGHLYVGNGASVVNNVSAGSTFVTNTATSGHLHVNNSVFVNTGIRTGNVTTSTLWVSGASTLNSLWVAGITSTGSLSVTGVAEITTVTSGGTSTLGNVFVNTTTRSANLRVTAESSAKTYTTDVAATTTALDFATEAFKTISINADTTFTASNYAVGRTITVLITNGATQRSLTFPSGWVFVGTKPSSIAASKKGVLTITSFGTLEADCIAAWAVQT